MLDSKVLTGTVDGDVFTTLQKVVFLKKSNLMLFNGVHPHSIVVLCIDSSC